jgi:hypothetical protein
MVRRRVGVCGLLVAIGLACQPAQAGDRKSARRDHEASEDIIVPSKTHAVSLKYELTGASTAKTFEAGSSASVGRRSSRDRGTPTADAPAREHRRLTLFHINSKIGDIAVEPVIGHVNGAQFSIGF